MTRRSQGSLGERLDAIEAEFRRDRRCRRKGVCTGIALYMALRLLTDHGAPRPLVIAAIGLLAAGLVYLHIRLVGCHVRIRMLLESLGSEQDVRIIPFLALLRQSTRSRPVTQALAIAIRRATARGPEDAELRILEQLSAENPRRLPPELAAALRAWDGGRRTLVAAPESPEGSAAEAARAELRLRSGAVGGASPDTMARG